MIRKIGRLIIRLLVIGLLALAVLPPFERNLPTLDDPRLREARVEVEQEWIHLILKGTPYEMGLQQGVLLRPYLQALVHERLYESLRAGGVASRDAQRYGRLVREHLSVALQEEIKGIAEGAGVQPEEILLWNLRDELVRLGHDLPFILQINASLRLEPSWRLMGLPRSQESRRLAWETPLIRDALSLKVDSTAFAFWGEATVNQERYLGALLPVSLSHERMLLMTRYSEGQHPVMGLALPGHVGLQAGINQVQLAVVMTTFATADHNPTLVPPAIRLRQLLADASTLDEAMQMLYHEHPSSGVTFLLTDESNPSPRRLEIAARQIHIDDNDHSLTIAAGSPLEGPLASTAALLPQPETLSARRRLAEWARLNVGFIDFPKVQKVLSESELHHQQSSAIFLWLPESQHLWLAQASEGQAAPASGWVMFEMANWWR